MKPFTENLGWCSGGALGRSAAGWGSPAASTPPSALSPSPRRGRRPSGPPCAAPGRRSRGSSRKSSRIGLASGCVKNIKQTLLDLFFIYCTFLLCFPLQVLLPGASAGRKLQHGKCGHQVISFFCHHKCKSANKNKCCANSNITRVNLTNMLKNRNTFYKL